MDPLAAEREKLRVERQQKKKQGLFRYAKTNKSVSFVCDESLHSLNVCEFLNYFRECKSV